MGHMIFYSFLEIKWYPSILEGNFDKGDSSQLINKVNDAQSCPSLTSLGDMFFYLMFTNFIFVSGCSIISKIK